MNDTQLNLRQHRILGYLATGSKAKRDDLEKLFKPAEVSRITIIRDLNNLIELGWIKQIGGGKYVTYALEPRKQLLTPFDLDSYFSNPPDSREVKQLIFNSGIIDQVNQLFSGEELKIFETGREKIRDRKKIVDPVIFKRELERFVIDFSWKSSQIEGNTYSLLETEELIKNKREASGHDRAEAIMILNHKQTFDLILSKRQTFKNISEMDIRSIHAAMTRELEVKPNIREFAVGITGTRYLPPDNKWQIEEALQQMVKKASVLATIPEKSLFWLVMIAYLQPFGDGNKRTARMLANAVLLAHGYYPLSYRSIDEVEYKKALIIFYEQNNLFHLKRLFIEQQQFAIENYFL